MTKKKARTSELPSDSGDEARVPASQRVAMNEDLLHHICLFLHKRQLVSLISVSRTFFGPAAKQLWYKLTDYQLYGLLGLLPPGVKQTEIRDRTTKTVTKKRGRALVSSDLDRWLLYSPFVRHVIMESIEPSDADVQLFHGLAQALPKQALLPNVAEMTVRYSEEKLEILKVLLCPSLQSIYLLGEASEEYGRQEHYVGNLLDLEDEEEVSLPFDMGESSPYGLIAFLNILPIHAPCLDTLHIIGMPADSLTKASISVALSQCIRALPNLSDVYLDNMGRSTSVLSSLALHKKLKYLTIEPVEHSQPALTDDADSPVEFSQESWYQQIQKCGQDVFKELVELSLLWTHSPGFSGDLLTHLRPPLSRLRITPSFSHKDSAAPLFGTIAQTCPELESLAFVVRGSPPSDFWTSLQSLEELALDELALVIADCDDVPEPNKHLLAIAAMHPDLTKLVFDVTQTGVDAIKEPTLGCLLSLAEICPKLTDLRLGSLWMSHDSSIPVVHNEDLKRLRIRDSDISASILAKFIAAVWPDASVVGFDKTEEINSIVDSVRHVRKVIAGEAELRFAAL